MRFLIVFSTLTLLLSTSLFSQGNENNFWYFGNNSNGIRFSKNTDKASNLISDQATPFGILGAASATDALSGNLYFYTDGQNIYDRNHQIMPGGNNMPGDINKVQPVIISPNPGNRNQYYVFFNTTSDEFTRVTVDISLAGNGSANEPLGQVIGVPQNTGIDNVSDAARVINLGGTTWVILQDKQENNLKIYSVQNDGSLNQLAASPAFEVAVNAKSIDFYRDTTDSVRFVIASNPVNGSSKNIQLVNMHANDLAFADPRQLNGSNDNNSEINAVCWSLSGMKLYYSKNSLVNNKANIFQYNPETEETNRVLTQEYNNYYDIKKGPDGQMYFLYQRSNSSSIELGGIALSDSLVDSLEVALGVFESPFANARVFPENAPAHIQNLTVDFENYPESICQNANVLFFPVLENAEDITNILWQFDEEGFSNALHPKFSFATSGPKQIRLSVQVGGSFETVEKTVNVTALNEELQVQDTTICELPFTYTLEDAPSGNLLWSNGETGPSATFDESGNYWVSLDNGTCSIYESFTITLYGEEKQQANVWYFGDQAGIDFNGTDGPQPLTDGAMSTPEGTATISDRNGDLLFYTDGETVWNKEHEVMTNGEEIGGNRDVVQNSVIVPIGADETLYYIFLTESVNDNPPFMKYVVVDMKENEGLGSVVRSDQFIYSPTTERISALGDFGNYQVLTHDFGNDNFRSFSINDNGLSLPEYVQEGVNHSRANPNNGKGYLRQTTDGNKLAVALLGDQSINFIRRIPQPNFANEEDVEISFFSIGENYEHILIDNLPGNPYGLSFSPDNNFLYVTLQGSTSRVYQFNVNDSLSLTEIDESGIEVFSTNELLGALQLSPNGQLFMAVDGASYLYQFTNLSIDARVDEFPEPVEFDLAGRQSTLGLPNFVQNFGTSAEQANMFVTAGCENDPIILEGSGTDPIDRFFWQIHAAGSNTILYSSNNQVDTVDVELAAGSYEASLRVTNVCGLDTLMTRNFQVFAAPDLSEVPSNAVFCGSNLQLGSQIPDAEGNTYAWSTGATSRIISVTEEGVYRVTATSANGCVSEAEIFVGPPFDVELGDDQAICQDESITLDANVNANSYSWFVNGVNQNVNSRTFEYTGQNAGVFTIRVEVPDPFDNSCPSTDEIELTVHEFSASLASSQDTGCGDNSGALELNVIGSGDYRIRWSDPNGNAITSADNSLRAENLAAGNYSATVTDLLTGCSTTLNNLSVNNDNITIDNVTATPVSNCGLSDGSINLTITGGTSPYDINVLDNENGNVVLNLQSNANNVGISGLEAGTYTVEIEDASTPLCSSSSNPIEITQPDDFEFSFSPSPGVGCGNNIEVVAQNSTQNTTFTWELDGNPITVQAIAQEPRTFRFIQSGIYTATVTEPGFCTVVRELEIIISQQAQIQEIELTPGCEGTVNLTAVLASGNPEDYVFTWDNGQQGQSISVDRAGRYQVTVSSAEAISNNCSDTDFIIVDEDDLPEIIEVSLEAENLCNESGEVELRAIANGNNPQYSWYRLTNGVRGNELAQSPAVIVSQSGIYEVEVSYNGLGSCENVFTRRRAVTILPPYEPNFDDVYLICPDSELEEERVVTLNAGSFNSYTWRQGNQVLSTASTYTFNEPGAYIFESSVAGCPISKEIIIELDCRPRVAAPNAFRPSASVAENRVFTVFPNQYVGDFQIVIFNRWGRMVYRSTDKDFVWDGVDFSGAAVPAGAYAYKISFTSNVDTNRTFEQRGSVTVVR